MGALLAKKDAKSGFVNLFITLLSLSSLIAIFVYCDRCLEKLPLILQRESAFSLWLSIGALSALFGGYARKNNKFLSVIVTVAFIPLFIFYTQPIYTQISPKESTKKVTYQTTLYSCACASLSTLLKQLGKPISERMACKESDTTRDGTSAGQLRYALARFDVAYASLHEKKRLQELSLPALLFVDRRGGYENHTIVLLKKERNRYIAFDPMEGWQSLHTQRLEKIWHGNGIEIKKLH